MPRARLGGDPLDRLCNFGKYKDSSLTWREVVETDPDWVSFILYETEIVVSNLLVEALEMELDG